MTKMVTIYTLMCYSLRDSVIGEYMSVDSGGRCLFLEHQCQRIYLIFDLSLRGLRSSQLLYIRT